MVSQIEDQLTPEWLSSFEVGERRYIETEVMDNKEVRKQITLIGQGNLQFEGTMFCAVAALDDGYMSRYLLCIERKK